MILFFQIDDVVLLGGADKTTTEVNFRFFFNLKNLKTFRKILYFEFFFSFLRKLEILFFKIFLGHKTDEPTPTCCKSLDRR